MVVILHLPMVALMKLDPPVVDAAAALVHLVLLVVLVVVAQELLLPLAAEQEILHQHLRHKVILEEMDVKIAHFPLPDLDILQQVVVVVEQLVEMQVLLLLGLVEQGIQFPNFLLRLFNQKFLHQCGQLLVLRLVQQVFMPVEAVVVDMVVFLLQEQEGLVEEVLVEFKMDQVLLQVKME
jgi:hypothetical protein